MATENALRCVTKIAAGNLSAKQYHFMEDTAGKVDSCNAAGERAYGVLQDKPEAADRACSVAVSGITKIKLGGTVASGDKVTTDNQGRAVAAVATNQMLGICEEGGAVGQIGAMLFRPEGVL
jgi:hypothetical protein